MINLEYYVDIARTLVIDNLLPDTCVITPQVRTKDSSGHYSVSDGTPRQYNSSTSIPCRIDPTKQYRDQDAFGQEITLTDYYFSLPFDMTIEPDDIITHNGLRYQIKKLSDDHSWKAVKRAFVIVLR